MSFPKASSGIPVDSADSAFVQKANAIMKAAGTKKNLGRKYA
jgi:hypothetical protein